jgi:hypothetical protein
VTLAVRAAALGLTMFVTLGAAVACTVGQDDSVWTKRVKRPSYAADSTRIVTIAIRALGDSLPMRVDGLTKGQQGWQVRLLPVRGGTVGGGTVWVDSNDSSATVVKRY